MKSNIPWDTAVLIYMKNLFRKKKHLKIRYLHLTLCVYIFDVNTQISNTNFSVLTPPFNVDTDIWVST